MSLDESYSVIIFSQSKIDMLLQLNATLVILRYYLYIFFPYHFIFDIKLIRILIWSGKVVILFSVTNNIYNVDLKFEDGIGS